MAKHGASFDGLSGHTQTNANERRDATVRFSRLGSALQSSGQISSNANHNARLSATKLHLQRYLLDSQHNDRRDKERLRNMPGNILQQTRMGRLI